MGRRAEYGKGISISAEEIRGNMARIKKRRGLSNKRLAELAGFPESKITKILNGTQEAAVSDLIALADALQVPVSALVSLKKDIDGVTLADACRALVTLDRCLGIRFSTDEDGRPGVAFSYSGLDGFMKYYRGMLNAAEDIGPEELNENLSAFMARYEERPLSVYSRKGTEEGRSAFFWLSSILPWPKDPEKDAEGRSWEALPELAPVIENAGKHLTREDLLRIREWIADAKRRKDWRSIRENVPETLFPGSPENAAAFVLGWVDILMDPEKYAS